MTEMQWIPLESNPEVLNKYAHGLGLSPEWNFMDVFSLDDDVLAMMPRPIAGVIFIYPITDKSEAGPLGDKVTNTDDMYFMKQTVSNACGTVAVLHTIGNAREMLSIEKDSTLDKFFTKSSDTDCTPEARAQLMATDEVQRRLRLLHKLIWSAGAVNNASLNTAHEAAASEGQTEAPSRDTKTNLHFVSLVNRNGVLIELDGRRDYPVQHGPTSEDRFLYDSANVIRQFMQREAKEVNFGIIILAKGEPLF